jgi:hypothetical protein
MMPRVQARPTAVARMPWGEDVRFALPSLRSLRPFALWLLVFAVGGALLYARYDWTPEGGRFAERGFLLSAYLLVILLPTCFYLARRILHSPLAAAVSTGFVFIVTTLPYELLGLDQFYYYDVRPHYFLIDQFGSPSLEFFPGGTLRAFPYDYLFMPLLFATGSALIWGVWWLRGRAGFATSRTIPVLLTVTFAVICVQAFAHTSMRAPYTYLSYFQLPESEHHWYHVYHFRDASGASEGDQYAFSPIEDYFHGAPRDGNNMLIRRPFSFYIAAQASYFINTFYVWLGLNCLFWLAAVVAIGRLVGHLTTARAGLIAGAMTAVGPGFVAFVGTPGMYMQYYAAIAIALCLFEDLVVRTGARSWSSVALFTGVLALCALVYDLIPLLLVLLAYGLARKVRPLPLLCSLVTAYAASRGFTLLVTEILGVTVSPLNAAQLSDALEQVADVLLSPSLEDWYNHTVNVAARFARLLLQAFFVVPVAVAVLGIPRLRDRSLQVLAFATLAMGFGTIAVLQIGEAKFINNLPRLVYPVFPAIYLLAAVALDWREPRPELSALTLRERIPVTVRTAAPWVVVGTLAVLSNIDLFGYPTLYVEFFVSDPPEFTPD